MKNLNFKNAAIIALLLAPQFANAFLTKADEALVVDQLQRFANSEMMGSHAPVAFDRINCNRAFCLLEMRFYNPQNDFGGIRNAKCVVENVRSAFDVLDENKEALYYPLKKEFVEEVKKCVAG